jgi:hypothetical protein
MALEDTVKIAYRISPIVRKYLDAFDKSKLPNRDPISLYNARLHSIVWRMLYNEPLLLTVDKDRLIFRWHPSFLN